MLLKSLVFESTLKLIHRIFRFLVKLINSHIIGS